MLGAILSSLFWVFLTATSLACFPFAVLVWAVTAPFDRRRRALHQFTCFWASLYTWFNPAWPVTIEGRERIRKGATYVMVANHQSLLDILVLFRLFVHFKWVSKAEIFRVPCIGWNMSLNRYIKLRRGDRSSIAEMMRHSGEALDQGSSIMIFPEGTRSVDGRLKKFKAGAHAMREDGHSIEAGENDNLIVQKLDANPAALGIFGFSFLDQNADVVQGSLIGGVEPSFENIAEGAYPVSRSLFFYVKKAHVGVIPGIAEFVAEFTSDKAWGDEGYLTDKGLIPLPTADRNKTGEMARNMAPLSM